MSEFVRVERDRLVNLDAIVDIRYGWLNSGPAGDIYAASCTTTTGDNIRLITEYGDDAEQKVKRWVLDMLRGDNQ